MAYIDSANLAIDATFQQTIRVAMVTAALNIMTESSNTANHTQRAVFAENILRNPNEYIYSFAFAVACNPAIPVQQDKTTGEYTTTASDSDIQFTVNSDFNSLAGISS